MSLHFDIDAHGRLVPGTDEVKSALADRAGRFLLLPSAADLLAARRVPAAGGAAPGPRMVLAGDLASFPIADFLGFLHTARLSGVLTIAAEGAERSVVFRDGEVRGAQSRSPGERIGEVALRLGYLEPEHLDLAVGAARPFGKVLVEKGLLEPADLWKCLQEQVTAIFHAILLAREGVFALVEGGETDLPGMPMAVNTQQLLMEGIRRIDEMGLFRTRIPGPAAYLRRRAPRRPVQLRPVEEQLLALADGRRTLGDIAAAAHLSEFDATKVLFHLVEAGYLEVAAEATAEQAADPAERLAEIARGMNAIYREIGVQVAAARASEPFLAAVRGFLADPGSRFQPLWKGLVPGRDATIDAEALLQNLGRLQGAALVRVEPSDEPARYLLDGLRELLFFALFQAGERLGRDADEALAAEVKRRLEALGGLP